MLYEFKFLDGEVFTGGTVSNGVEMPYTASTVKEFDFTRQTLNQTMPLYVSNKGRYIWSDNPFKISFVGDGTIKMDGKDIILVEAGKTLKDAYMHAMKNHFPFDGRPLPEKFFETAQYNSWMEFIYDPTQEGILDYAKNIIKHGFEPGILIIDEGWHGRYGNWEFDPAKFPKPKEMVDELHEMGFIVLLWVCPLVCPDGRFFITHTFPSLNPEGTSGEIFLRTAKGTPAIVNWWNGMSAILDLRKEVDCNFLDRQLQHLMKDYGIDGFKFDGGTVHMYHAENVINAPVREDHDPYAMNKAWNEFGRRYTYHEYKDTYHGGGINCIQRLLDRYHRWTKGGIDTLIPCTIAQGLIGHPFTCPDMIGGGEWSFFHRVGENNVISEELFVRMAQVSALCPMMQFSWAPWRSLSEENLGYVVDAAKLHKKFAPEIIRLVKISETSGEPIVRSLEYNDPGKGYERIVDQFMVGEDILVCPVVTPDTFKKECAFPEGTWLDEDGNEYAGGQYHVIDTPLSKLRYFVRKK